MKFKPIQKDIEACQWKGHDDKEYDLADYPVLNNPGATGYQGKLGYIQIKGQNPVIVRPKDYVIVEAKNKVKTMIPAEFEAKYEPKVENSGKSANNGKKSGDKTDNAQKDIEEVI